MGICTSRRLAGTLWLLACIPACRNDAPATSAPTPTPARQPIPASLRAGAPLTEVAAAAGGIATAVDARGVPQFLWATSRQPAFAGATPETAARFHLGRFAPAQGLTSAALSSTEVAHVHNMGPGGIITRLRQRIDGIEVYHGDVKILMRSNLELVAISGRLQSTTVAGAGGRNFRRTPAEALSGALNHRYGAHLSAGQVVDLGPGHAQERRLQLATGAPINLAEQARTKKVYFPEGDRLVPAYLVEFYAGKRDSVESEAYRYVVAADDGRVLETRNLTANDSFDYRVWADTTGDRRPLDGPQADYTPHPTGTPDGSEPAFIPPNLVSIEGFNRNPDGLPDPWLAAAATQTLGNNVDAYSDFVAPDGYSNGDFRAATTGPRVFDYTYDTALGPQANPNQTLAAVIQAFYVVNWLHDWFYDSGFTEAAGNAQLDNFRRGGEGGDHMRVEVQDSYLVGQRNNANMSTPEDGFQPRMQIYVFTGPDTRRLTLNPSGTIYATGTAAFGAGNFNLTADVVLADDGSTANPTPGGPAGTVNDGCQPLVNNVAGQIALIDRGTCNFAVKAANAQAAGAVGVLIANNVASTNPNTLGGTDPTVTIPVASVTQATGNALRNLLPQGPVNVTMFRQLAVERDAALDNMIVAHEWGHYLHHRLADCGAGQCGGLSEGWGDFTALLMALREGDNLDGTYAAGVYAPRTFGDSAYYGIRRFAYSYDMTRNGLTLRHISAGEALPNVPRSGNGSANNAEVHNTGEVWASMMFDAYVALQRARPVGRTFDDVRRRMTDYVVAGLLLSPRDATFTEQRDSILAAIAARDPDDLTVAANAFARRGNGSCAVVPDRYSADLVGVTESYELRPRSEIGLVTLDDSAGPCDRDGVLDAGERGLLTVQVANGGPMAMSGATVRVSSTTPGITFPNGASVTLGTLPPFGATTVTLEVALDASVSGITTFDFDVAVDHATACQATVTRSLVARVNFDNQSGASATDTVESTTSAWTRTGIDAEQVWQRTAIAPTNYAWVGIDASSGSDTRLESPDLVVSATDPLIIRFDHRYQFEQGGGTNFDGGVIEVRDGGAWRDISTYVNPGYGGALTTGNPLAGRNAFVGQSAGWPNTAAATLDLGTALAGRTIRIRFRIATDAGVGAFGWQLDNLAFSGITNLPFSTLVDNANQCIACDVGLTQCGGRCTDLQSDVANCGTCGSVCPSGTLCSRGQCVAGCPTGFAACGGACVDVQSDGANCGGCGIVCRAGSVCSAGQCALSCQAGLTNCNGRCSDLASDLANCGRCGTACPAGSVCSVGVCSVSCQQGLNVCNGRCTDLQSDLANCGSCGTACPAGSVCSSGQCALSCQQGLTICNGRCTDLQSDLANCGSCDTACPSGTVCSAGQCTQSCQQGLTICNGRCTDLQTDLANCGGCSNACPAGAVCSAGQCSTSCQQGLTDCNGRCADLQADGANCGRCGNACAAGSVCSAGQCTRSCQQGLTNCNGTCTDLRGDRSNCGSCGTACAAGSVCSAGLCTLSCQQGLTECSGRCADLQTDEANCGNCGTACPANSLCSAGRCQRPPVVRTGPAQVIQSGRTVTLDASQSTDPEGDPLTFAWIQVAGPTVSLSRQDLATPTFTAPTVTARTRLAFQVSVSDGLATVSATVDVFVDPADVGGPIGSGGGGCSVSDRHESPAPLALLLAPALLALFWRRRQKGA